MQHSLVRSETPVSESYDDIEKLLSHEMLGTFEYQSFKKTPISVPAADSMTSVSVRAAADEKNVKTSSFTLPELTRPESRQLRLVASKSDATRPATPPASPAPAANAGEVDRLFQRLTRVVPDRPAPAPVLDLHLPERPMLPARAARKSGLAALPPQEAFARMLGQPRFVDALSA